MNYIYRFIDYNEEIIYIGKTSDIKRRIKEHLTFGHLPKNCYNSINKIEYIKTGTKTDTEITETLLINKYKPFYNRDKKYPEHNSSSNYTINEGDMDWKPLYISYNNTIEISIKPIQPDCLGNDLSHHEAEKELILHNTNMLSKNIGLYMYCMPGLYADYGISIFKEMEFIYLLASNWIISEYSSMDSLISENYSNPDLYVAFSINALEGMNYSLKFLLIMIRCGLLVTINDSILGIPYHNAALLKNADQIYKEKTPFIV